MIEGGRLCIMDPLMAIIYGSDSEFITNKKAKRRKTLWIFLTAFIISILLIWILLLQLGDSIILGSIIVFFLLSGLLLSTMRDAWSRFWWIRKTQGWSDRGLLGERIIKQKLEALPDTYTIFRNFHPVQAWDNDFIVVGLNGVFAIEAKSQTGYITFDHGGRGIHLLRQARNEAYGLHTYLLEGWKIKTYVTGILVFARSGAKLQEVQQPLKSTYVIKADQLVQTILNHRGSNPQKEIIEKCLRSFYQT